VTLSRRSLLKNALLAGAWYGAVGRSFAQASSPEILGQGDFKYRVVPGWGVLDEKTPVNDCHGLARTADGHIILLTNHVTNNVLFYGDAGKLVNKWTGPKFPGAHGLSLVRTPKSESLFITDLNLHTVTQRSLAGQALGEWPLPTGTGKYGKASDYRPSWTLHRADGEFYVLDGYGKDYILHYAADGSFKRVLGGPEGGIVHWGPHGGTIDTATDKTETMLIAMSDQQYLLRLDLDGKKLTQIDLPGGNPRQIRRMGQHYVVAHLADNWPKDRDSRGFLSILDQNLRVVSNLAGTAPVYDATGKLLPMKHAADVFRHPHDVLANPDGSLIVAQFASGQTYPLKLERV
jgi:peptidylamidoglycolate lyase